MADDLTKRRPQDATKINVQEAWEVAYWCKELRVSEAELKAAVRAVGVMVSAVRRHLGR